MSAFRVIVWAFFAALAFAAERADVTVLATTDLHGNILPLDYFIGRPAERGLARLATLIREVRRENPNTLLIDCGDTIQGSPLESVWQYWVANGRLPLRLAWAGAPPRVDPMMAAMNELGYRAMVLGNHEFNFGLKNLNAARAAARFPWLSANTLVEPGAKVRPFAAYIVEKIGGVKIAVIGLTTPAIPRWEQPANYAGYRFVHITDAAGAAVAELRKKQQPDIIIAAIHSGLGDGGDDENSVSAVASGVAGIDAIFFGHTHNAVAGKDINGVLAVQPRNWGISLGRIDFTLERAGRRWRVAGRKSALLPAARTAADPAVLKLAEPYHRVTEQYLSTPIAESPADLDGRFGRVRDTALVDAIHAVQMHYAKADVSFTALFNPRVTVRKGPVTVRDVAALYTYDNELFAIGGTGAMVKQALENAARFFLSCPDAACSHGPLINRAVIGYQFDMAQGVEYEIDLTRPAGERIVNLRRNGRPLVPGDRLRIAVNNYRYGGSGGYSMFRGAKILWQSSQDIRNLMIEYFTERRRLPDRPDNNWRVVPPAALRELERNAASFGDSSR